MFSTNWQCPYCNSFATLNSSNYLIGSNSTSIKNITGAKVFKFYFIMCPNPSCNNYTLTAELYDAKYEQRNFTSGFEYFDLNLVKEWNLVPGSNAKAFPTYIPQAILKDYKEACAIRNLSPKASATLSRRCLQGMIRHFWDVKEANLYKEIDAIKDRIDPLTLQSIDAVRKIGNIGAHMEKDIDVIVEVEPNEASLLINLIELLLKEWYVNKFERELQLKKLIEVSGVKEILKKEKQ